MTRCDVVSGVVSVVCVAWCGVVWCGVVWCGVVWCGVVWCECCRCGGAGCPHVVARSGAAGFQVVSAAQGDPGRSYSPSCLPHLRLPLLLLPPDVSLLLVEPRHAFLPARNEARVHSRRWRRRRWRGKRRPHSSVAVLAIPVSSATAAAGIRAAAAAAAAAVLAVTCCGVGDGGRRWWAWWLVARSVVEVVAWRGRVEEGEVVADWLHVWRLWWLWRQRQLDL